MVSRLSLAIALIAPLAASSALCIQKGFRILQPRRRGANHGRCWRFNSVAKMMMQRSKVLTISDEGGLDLTGKQLKSLTGLSELPFPGRVKRLYLGKNNLTSIAVDDLASFKNLEFIDLSGNTELRYIDRDAFTQLSSLHKVIIDSNVAQNHPIQHALTVVSLNPFVKIVKIS